MSGGKRYEYKTADVTQQSLERLALSAAFRAYEETYEHLSCALFQRSVADSPIEEALLVEVLAVCDATYTGYEAVRHDGDHVSTIAKNFELCSVDEDFLFIAGQAPVGPYRADFVLQGAKVEIEKDANGRPISLMPVPKGPLYVVECDGTAFHERTEAERRYEKQRDRWMQRKHIKVLRFTGKEILDSPTDVATECLRTVFPDDREEFEGWDELFAYRDEYMGVRR